jgi:hypothetical protein
MENGNKRERKGRTTESTLQKIAAPFFEGYPKRSEQGHNERKEMGYLKYSWLIGVFGGGWLVWIARHDRCEGPYIQFFGLVVAVICLVKLMEAYRRAIVAEIKEKEPNSKA